MEEKEILKLLRVRKKHLNKKVSEEKLKIRYCRNFSSTKNELNYFVVKPTDFFFKANYNKFILVN